MDSEPDTPTRGPQHGTEKDSVEAFPTPPRDSHQSLSMRVKNLRSPGPTKLMDIRAASTPPEINRDTATPTLSRGKGQGLLSVTTLEKNWQRQQMSKKKSQYFSDAFAYREPNNTPKYRVQKDSVVMAEVKLNTRLEAEPEFLLDLSFQVAEIYHRPESSVMVSVTPEVQIVLGGSAEPAYHVTISALQSELGPTTNKRSTHFLQEFMLDTLHISPRRGVIQFEGLAEEDLATNGMTALQEIEELERRHDSEDSGVLRTISRQSRRAGTTLLPIFTERGKTPAPSTRTTTPSHLKFSTADTLLGTGDSRSSEVSGPEKKRVKHRKSIMAFFKRS